jgi:hypothetical protein
MRNKTQERIEELARERAATTIDLALVEDGIEIGKKMMAEMIANYSAPSASSTAGAKPFDVAPSRPEGAPAPAPGNGNGNGSGRHMLNEVSPLTVREHQS